MFSGVRTCLVSGLTRLPGCVNSRAAVRATPALCRHQHRTFSSGSADVKVNVSPCYSQTKQIQSSSLLMADLVTDIIVGELDNLLAMTEKTQTLKEDYVVLEKIPKHRHVYF